MDHKVRQTERTAEHCLGSKEHDLLLENTSYLPSRRDRSSSISKLFLFLSVLLLANALLLLANYTIFTNSRKEVHFTPYCTLLILIVLRNTSYAE